MKKQPRKSGQPTTKREVLRLNQGMYSDGHPLDDLHYLECKLILNGGRFTMGMTSLVRMPRSLQTLKLNSEDKTEPVNQTYVEEVAQDIGRLDFGEEAETKSNVTARRTRGNQKQLVGEFAFQAKMERRSEFHAVAKSRCEQFFIALQHIAEQWLTLGTTKTGAVCRVKGNPSTTHE